MVKGGSELHRIFSWSNGSGGY